MAKKKREPRTNAMRLLDAHNVTYEVFTFSSEIHSAIEVAKVLSLEPKSVYKTLVVERSSDARAQQVKPLLVMVAGDAQIDLSALAGSVGEKKLRMASHHDAEALTKLRVGGISALALMNKGFTICIDEAARDLAQVTISAGKRGINLRLAVEDLVCVTKARWVDATGQRSEGTSTQWDAPS